MMASGSMNAMNAYNGSEAMEPQLIQIPDYDEDLEEAFAGPYSGELDETYDDAYEAESAAILEGQTSQASTSSRGVVSDHTQYYMADRQTAAAGPS